MQSALKAQAILAEKYGVSADVWSATSYKLLRTDAIRCQRWNMLHPTEPPQKSYLESLLAEEQGAFVAVSDNIRTVPDQIAPWVPGGLFTLGTDGFGRSDTRARLRRFFAVDAESTVVGTLYALAEKKLMDAQSRGAGDQRSGRGPGTTCSRISSDPAGSHRFLPAAIGAFAVQVNQDVARFGAFAGADDAAVFEFVHDARGAAVAQAQAALEQGDAGLLLAADDLDALLDDFLVLVNAALVVASRCRAWRAAGGFPFRSWACPAWR